MPNLIAVKQIRQNELYDYVNGLLSSGISQVSGVSGVLGYSGIYADYTNGLISIAYTGEAGGIDVETLNLYLATGDYSLKDTVRTTGEQTISGFKYFESGINVNNHIIDTGLSSLYLKDNLFYLLGTGGTYFDINQGTVSNTNITPGNPALVNFNSGHLNVSKFATGIYRPYVSLDWLNTLLYSNTGTPTLITANWGQRILSGDWISNVNPTQSGNIVNKGYVDNNFVNINSGSNGGNLPDSGKYAKFDRYGQLDYGATIVPDLNHDIDKRIWGLTPSTGNKQIFSVANHSTATYIRNTGCWAYGIDLSPISVWNSQGVDQRGGILISPRHILMANHFAITGGSILRWVDNNNNVISGGLSGSIAIPGSDLRIGVLSGDVTGNISYAKVFSTGFTGYFNTSGIPLFFTDQEEKALVGETNSFFGSNVNISQSSSYYRSGFYELPTGGDSSNPVCSVIGNELVILTTFFSDTAGPYISNTTNYLNVNSGMSSLGNGNNYQLTPVSSNYFPISWNSIKDSPNFNNIVNNYFSSGGGTGIVYTTGDQDITGNKNLLGFTNLSSTVIKTTSSGAFLSVLRDGAYPLFSVGTNSPGFIAGGNGVKMWGNPDTEPFTVVLSSFDKQLSGNWATNTTPTISTHIINKGYLDTQTGNLYNIINSYQRINISGSGVNTAAPSGRNHSIYLDITSGTVGNYSGTLVLPTGNKILGDRVAIHANYEASTRPNVQIYSNTTGDANMLFSWSGDGTATKIYIDCLYTGLGYILFDAHFLG